MVILFILMLIAAFVGTIFAFRAAKRIHDGADFGYEMVVCAVCVTFVVYVLKIT